MTLKTFDADDSFFSALTFGNQCGTVAGTVWRLVHQTGTLVATPSRLDGIQPKAHNVPERIESILGGPHGLAALGYAVRYAVQCQTDHNFESTPAIEKLRSELRQADRRKTSQTEIHEKLKKIESEQAQLKKQNHASALDQLRQSLAELGLKKVSKSKLEELFHYIDQLFKGRTHSPPIRHADYQQIIQQAERLTQHKLFAAVRANSLSAYGLTEAQVCEQTQFLAVFRDGHTVPVDHLQISPHMLDEWACVEKLMSEPDFESKIQKSVERFEKANADSVEKTTQQLALGTKAAKKWQFRAILGISNDEWKKLCSEIQIPGSKPNRYDFNKVDQNAYPIALEKREDVQDVLTAISPADLRQKRPDLAVYSNARSHLRHCNTLALGRSFGRLGLSSLQFRIRCRTYCSLGCQSLANLL